MDNRKNNFDIDALVDEIDKSLNGKAVAVGGDGSVKVATIKAISFSIGVSPFGIGMEISIDGHLMALMKKFLPDGAYDEWCAETSRQAAKLPWFSARSQELGKLLATIMAELSDGR